MHTIALNPRKENLLSFGYHKYFTYNLKFRRQAFWKRFFIQFSTILLFKKNLNTITRIHKMQIQLRLDAVWLS